MIMFVQLLLLVIARNEAICSLILNLLLFNHQIASSFLLAMTFVFCCHTELVRRSFFAFFLDKQKRKASCCYEIGNLSAKVLHSFTKFNSIFFFLCHCHKERNKEKSRKERYTSRSFHCSLISLLCTTVASAFVFHVFSIHNHKL
jgi:hypothetical protein